MKIVRRTALALTATAVAVGLAAGLAAPAQADTGWGYRVNPFSSVTK